MNENKTKKIRSRWLTIRLTEEEEKTLRKFFRQSTSGNFSSYARNILLHKPVTLKYRNQSLDEFLLELVQLKRELNAIGNNLNQSVHRLHTLDHTDEILSWIKGLEQYKSLLQNKTNEIKNWMNKLYEIWSPE